MNLTVRNAHIEVRLRRTADQPQLDHRGDGQFRLQCQRWPHPANRKKMAKLAMATAVVVVGMLGMALWVLLYVCWCGYNDRFY